MHRRQAMNSHRGLTPWLKSPAKANGGDQESVSPVAKFSIENFAAAKLDSRVTTPTWTLCHAWDALANRRKSRRAAAGSNRASVLGLMCSISRALYATAVTIAILMLTETSLTPTTWGATNSAIASAEMPARMLPIFHHLDLRS